MSDFETNYARHKELCANANELNKAVLFDALTTPDPKEVSRPRGEM